VFVKFTLLVVEVAVPSIPATLDSITRRSLQLMLKPAVNIITPTSSPGAGIW
jgi:hypothetical protein